MKAVIMAGGTGTRLRPLTCKQPKPMVPLATRPVMEYIVGLLRRHGLTEIGVTLFYLPEIIRNYFGQGDEFGVTLHYFIENTPLGTAGSVKNAEQFLDRTFLVISGDALTDFNLEEAIAYHQSKRALATLVLTRVNNPLEYGVVITDEEGRIRRFLEKPGWGEVFSDTVNTGIYLLEPEIFKFYEPGKAVDFSKDLFPRLLAEGQPLYGYVADGYWSDIGNLDQYRQANYDLLSGKVRLPLPGREISPGIWAGAGAEIHRESELKPPVVIGEYARIKKGVKVDGYSVFGHYTHLQENVSVKRSILWNHVYVGNDSQLRGAILSHRTHLKSQVAVYEGAVLGEGCTVGNRSLIRSEVKVWPEKYIESGSTLNNSLVWGTRWSNTLFGTLGVDKTVNRELTPEFVARLGVAYGSLLPEKSRVVISADHSRPARMLKRAMIAGFMATGVNLFDLGMMTTPITRYAVVTLEAAGGVHLRTSPRNTDGVLIEFLDEKGFSIDRALERKIEQIFFTEEYRRVAEDKIGEVFYMPYLFQRYVAGILSTTDPELIRKAHFKVVANYDSGILSLLLPTLLQNLGCTVVHCQTMDDNQEARVKTLKELLSVLDEVGERVRQEGADLGIVVDNNAERLILLDEKGRLVQDEQFVALIAFLILKYSQHNTIAVPVTAPRIIEELSRAYRGKVIRTKANSRSLMEKVAEEKIFAGRDGKTQFQPAFDAMLSLVKIMELTAREQVSLSELVATLPPYYMDHKAVECSWDDKGRVMRTLFEQNKDREIETVDGLKVFHDEGWALVLPDAEEPVIRIYSEAGSPEQAAELTKFYMETINELQMK